MSQQKDLKQKQKDLKPQLSESSQLPLSTIRSGDARKVVAIAFDRNFGQKNLGDAALEDATRILINFGSENVLAVPTPKTPAQTPTTSTTSPHPQSSSDAEVLDGLPTAHDADGLNSMPPGLVQTLPTTPAIIPTTLVTTSTPKTPAVAPLPPTTLAQNPNSNTTITISPNGTTTTTTTSTTSTTTTVVTAISASPADAKGGLNELRDFVRRASYQSTYRCFCGSEDSKFPFNTRMYAEVTLFKSYLSRRTKR